jgi:hypothetical protein
MGMEDCAINVLGPDLFVNNFWKYDDCLVRRLICFWNVT